MPCDPLTAQNLDPAVCFEVFATTLGGPANATVDVVCNFSDDCLLCDTEANSCALGGANIVLVRNSGKPVQQNITSHFRADGCIDLGGVVGVCDAGDISFNNEWIFNIEQLLEYYWDYTNNGLRLTQLRFCDTEGVPGSDCEGGVIIPVQ